jgi:hypothetical protein
MNCRIEKISERRSYGEIGNGPRYDHRRAKAMGARGATMADTVGAKQD